jgi:hypothetical protein
VFAEYGCTDLVIYGHDEQPVNADQADQIALAHEMGLKVMSSSTQSELVTGDWDLVNTNGDWFSILHSPEQAFAAYWHARGAKIYSYSNPQGGVELPETYRRNYGLKLWQADYDGSLPYGSQTVNSGGGWDEFGLINYSDTTPPYGYKGHNMIYPTVDAAIDTVQWEGFREGVNDARYLNTLIEAITTAQGEGKDTTAAESYLATLKSSSNLLDLETIRSEMINHILSLGSYNQPSDSEEDIITVNQIQEDWDINEDDPIYQSLRYNLSGYSLPVPNDTYTVTLHFTEMYFTSPGSRVFDATIEGVLLINDLDMVAVAGPATAFSRQFTGVEVLDGQLDIGFVPVTNYPQINGIEIVAESGVPTTYALRVNAGGSEYVDTQGHTWSADYGYIGGAIYNPGTSVAGTWDINGDGVANVLDMILIGQRWGETGLSGWIKADTNKDGTINVLDMIIIGQHWT